MSSHRIWGVRAGNAGQADHIFIERDQIALSFSDAGGDASLLPPSRGAFKEAFSRNGAARVCSIPIQAGQLYRFVHEMRIGDRFIYPRKCDRTLRWGEVVGPYVYDPEGSGEFAHRRSIRWIAKFSRDEFTQGALYELGSTLALFEVKSYSEEFLRRFEAGGGPADEDGEENVVRDIAEATRDFIARKLRLQFKGFAAEAFIADLFCAMGYKAHVTRSHRDDGVDVVAHKDELGIEPPILKIPALCINCTKPVGTRHDSDSTNGRAWYYVSDMWRLFETPLARRLTTAEGIASFFGMVWSLWTWIAAGVTGMTAAVLAFLDGYSWLGIASAFMAFAIATASGVLVLAIAGERRAKAKGLSTHTPAASPTPSGDALSAVGTVSDPLPFDPEGLYVGMTLVGIGELAEKRTIEITMRCFNASNRSICVRKIDGLIAASAHKTGEPQIPLGELPPPWLIERDDLKNIGDNKEFVILIEQRVPPEVGENIAAVTKDFSIHLKLDGLNVIVSQVDNSASGTRLPVWDGIRIARNPEGVISGRIINMRASVAARISVQ